jgi:hypothetical protein
VEDYADYISIQGGGSDRDRTVARVARTLQASMEKSLNYVGPKCKSKARRNGVEQGFVVTISESRYKYKISALPGEDLFCGDVIECFGEHWIVVETRVASPLYTSGLMWLCNFALRFQNGSSTIHERHAVLDSGVYSTSLQGTEHIQSTDKQFKAYIPLDRATERLFIDKRVAVNRAYNADAEEILTCFKVVGVDTISRAYGSGGHLLTLNLRSSEFDPQKDSISAMICDYIGEYEDGSCLQECNERFVDGAAFVRAGSGSQYKAVRVHPGGETEPLDIPVVWKIDPEISGVCISTEGCLFVSLYDRLIGTEFDIVAETQSGEPLRTNKKVKVI